MVTQREPPDPSKIIALLPSRISIQGLKTLPSTLQLYAHLQLLSQQIRREARRALDFHQRLTHRLENGGIQPKEWCRLGALTKAEGRTLKAIVDEGQGEGEVSREDVMMELSFGMRLMHLGLLLATKKTTPDGKLRDLLDNYFPPQLSSPPSHSDKEDEELQDGARAELRQWEEAKLSHVMCFVRAMTEHQARTMGIYRKTAEAMFDMLQKALRDGTTRPTWYELMPDKKSRAEEEIQRFKRDMMTIADTIRRDKEVIEGIFADFDEEGEDVEIKSEQEGDVDHGDVMGDIYIDGSKANRGQTYIEINQDYRPEQFGDQPIDDGMYDAGDEHEQSGPTSSPLVNTAATATRQLVEEDRDPHDQYSHPPPSLRLASSPSPVKPSTARFRSITHSAKPLTSTNVSHTSPYRATPRKPRSSGLPPPDGPDFTAPLPISKYNKEDLRPFENTRLIHAGRTASPGSGTKRPRVSGGNETVEIQEPTTKKRMTLDR